MCVIFYQTKEQNPLTYEEFVSMAKKNPHGMGWMANVNGIIKYKKGYFNVNNFYNDYLELRNNPNLIDIACHFRIGTGSNIDVANCHPFPITRNRNRIKSAEGHADVLIMMNGIIGNSTNEFSDTALYTMKNLREYYDVDNRFFLHFNKRQEFLFENEISGTRFVFMSKDGTRLFGNGWSDYDGKCKVSNRYWIPYKPQKDYSYYRDYYYSSDDNYESYDDYYMKNAKRFAPNKDGSRHKSYIDKLMEGIV